VNRMSEIEGSEHGGDPRQTPLRAEPESVLQRNLCTAFCEALSLSEVGMDDDFFDLGGDSLNGETLALLLTQVLGTNFPIASLLECSTPRLIERQFAASAPLEPKTVADTVPFFLVHGKGGYTFLRPDFLNGLAKGRKMVVFELPGLRDQRKTPHRIEGIAKAYVTQLLEAYPAGPIFLASFCAGGLVAIEMAHQLRALGRPAEHIVLVDPGTPNEMILRHEGKTDSILRRITLAPITGRFSGRVAPADFEDDRLFEYRVKASTLRRRIRMAMQKLRRTSTKRSPLRAFSIDAKARLSTSYRHYWTRPLAQRVDVICSRRRMPGFTIPGGLWSWMIPECSFHPMFEEHKNIASRDTAELLEDIFARASSVPSSTPSSGQAVSQVG